MTTIQIKVPNWLDFLCAWPAMVYRQWKYGYSFRRIFLGEGEWTILDSVDYYRFRNFKWWANGNGTNIYAARSVKTGPVRTKIIYLQREIMNAPKGLLVDHRNSNPLDNRRANLRLATHQQNACNCKIDKSNTSSRFRGVYFRKNTGKWTANITCNGKSIWLGGFDNEIEAARAYDRAAIKYHGEFASLNFPREDYNVEILTTNQIP